MPSAGRDCVALAIDASNGVPRYRYPYCLERGGSGTPALLTRQSQSSGSQIQLLPGNTLYKKIRIRRMGLTLQA